MIDRNTFMYGEIIVTAKGQPQFLPGIYNNSTEDFTPGVVLWHDDPDISSGNGRLDGQSTHGHHAGRLRLDPEESPGSDRQAD